MVKKISCLFTLLLFVSCFTIRNNEGRVRTKLNRFSIKIRSDDSSIYSLIDTAGIYMVVENKYPNNEPIKIDSVTNGIKFYKNCRVGLFHDINLKNTNCLNPKLADMGFYNLNDDIVELEFLFYHVQSGNFICKKEFTKVKVDTIIGFTKKTSTGGGYFTTYVKRELPKEFLIYKPDW